MMDQTQPHSASERLLPRLLLNMLRTGFGHLRRQTLLGIRQEVARLWVGLLILCIALLMCFMACLSLFAGIWLISPPEHRPVLLLCMGFLGLLLGILLLLLAWWKINVRQ
jgi:uncharacterized membrane protein